MSSFSWSELQPRPKLIYLDHSQLISQSSFNSQDTYFNSQLSTPPLADAQPPTTSETLAPDSGDYFQYKPRLRVNTDAAMSPGYSFITPVDEDVEAASDSSAHSIILHLSSFDHQPFSPSLSPYNFLLVDDNVINLRILSKILKKLYPRATITEEQDSTKVMDLLWTNDFDVTFLDIEMPNVSGTEIATKIRKTAQAARFATMGLIAVTTRNMFADIKFYDSVGIDYTLAKPLNYSHLYIMGCIERVISARTN